MKKLILLLLVIISVAFPQDQPKHEFRGVWIATVANIDWPSSRYLTVTQQKNELISILEKLKVSGVNAVFFQVRTECDALYNSPYEPWSYWLTGQQGKAPSPLYDPLQFAVEEAHKRGLELHAWVNPYRAVKTVTGSGSYSPAQNHISVAHPDWLLQLGNYKFLNPGLPEVQEFISKVFMDILRRYDIDGLHMDDYFYPYPDPTPITTQDTATFSIYNRGITDINDWRRDNINMLVKEISDSVEIIKPWVKWGVSPFGIWRPGYPSGISGFDAYASIYCDPIAWLQAKSVEYITPQLYWPFGGTTDYGLLMPWWADSTSANGRHLYIGQASYRISTWGANEMPHQLQYNRSEPNCQGSVFFRAQDFLDNPKGFTDSLQYDFYRTPSIPNLMSWEESVSPNAPSNLRLDSEPSTGEYILKWDAPSPASDGDTARRYAVYRFASTPSSGDLGSGNNLFGLTGVTNLPKKYSHFQAEQGQYFVVTALDKNNNESGMSNVLMAPNTPAVPTLINPSDNSQTEQASVTLKWKGDINSGAYNIEVALDSNFSNKIATVTAIHDTFYTLNGLTGQTIYFWRVKALGLGGVSSFSPVRSFKTALPGETYLYQPAHATYITTLTPTLIWYSSPAAVNYQMQIGTGNPITTSNLIFDTLITADTAYTTFKLTVNKNHFWHVKAKNQYGEGPWSATWGFKTPSASDAGDESGPPENFSLDQNFPNPFNPSTIIRFKLPQTEFVSLKIFDILGNEITTLINKEMPAGYYQEEFSSLGFQLSSGIYIYRLTAGQFSASRKLVLVK